MYVRLKKHAIFAVVGFLFLNIQDSSAGFADFFSFLSEDKPEAVELKAAEKSEVSKNQIDLEEIKGDLKKADLECRGKESRKEYDPSSLDGKNDEEVQCSFNIRKVDPENPVGEGFLCVCDCDLEGPLCGEGSCPCRCAIGKRQKTGQMPCPQ